MTTRIQAENSARPNFPSHTLSLSELSKTENITYSAATTTYYSHNHGPAPVHATKPNVPTTDVAQSAPKYPINEPYPCNSGQLSLSVPTTVAYSTPNYPDNGSSTTYSHSNEVPVKTFICSVSTSVTHSKPNYPENAYHHPSTPYTHANHTPLNMPITLYPYNRLQKHSPNVPATVASSTPNYPDNGSSTTYSHSNEVPVQTFICSVSTSVTQSKPNYPENAYHHPSTSYTHANHTPLNIQTLYPYNRLQKHSPNVPATVASSTPNYPDNRSSTSYSHSIEVPVQTSICSVPTSVTHSKPNYPENAYHHPSTPYTHANHTPLNIQTLYPYNRLQKHSPNVPATVASSTPNYSDSTYNIEELSDRSSESSISSEENNHGIGLLSGIAIGSSEYLIYYITLLNH